MIGKYADMAMLGGVAALAIGLTGYIWHLKASAKRAEARAEAADTRAGQHAMAASQWEASALQTRVDLAACQAQWAEAKNKAASMVAEANARRIRAEAEAQTWRKRWDARPQGCSAALAALDTACPALDGY